MIECICHQITINIVLFQILIYRVFLLWTAQCRRNKIQTPTLICETPCDLTPAHLLKLCLLLFFFHFYTTYVQSDWPSFYCSNKASPFLIQGLCYCCVLGLEQFSQWPSFAWCPNPHHVTLSEGLP